MSSMQVFEANRGTRHEVESAELVLRRAAYHLCECNDMVAADLIDVFADVLLEDDFQSRKPNIRRGGL